MRLLEPEQPPNKERCRWQNVPEKTGNKVICVKPSSDLEINFAYQVILNFDWHKVLYFPSHCFIFKSGKSHEIKKWLKQQQKKIILEIFFNVLSGFLYAASIFLSILWKSSWCCLCNFFEICFKICISGTFEF